MNIKFTDEFLIKISKGCKSVSEIMRKAGYDHINGYAHFRFKKRLEQVGIKIDGKQAKVWNKGNVDIHRLDIKEYLVLNGPSINTSKLKHRLYKAGLKTPKCESCGIEKWLNKPLRFHLDHIDGNKKNCLINNLRVLCPNCHSQTVTYAVIKRNLKND